MTLSDKPNLAPSKRWIIYLIVVGLFIWGQGSIRRANRIAQQNLSTAQVEQQRLESIYTANQNLHQKKKQLRNQLQDCRSDLITEIRSFKRPAMLAALMDRLQFPENCIFTSTYSGYGEYSRTLIFASQAGQQLVVPVWRQEEGFGRSITTPPTHEIVIDVPPGQLKHLEVGLRDGYTDHSNFVVKIDEKELLNIDLHGQEMQSRRNCGIQAFGLFSPGVISKSFGGNLHRKTLPSLLKQGCWLDQQEANFGFINRRTKAETFLAFSVYWRTNEPLAVEEDGLYWLPPEFRKSVNLNYDQQAALYRIQPKSSNK